MACVQKEKLRRRLDILVFGQMAFLKLNQTFAEIGRRAKSDRASSIEKTRTRPFEGIYLGKQAWS
jgi:hypothetical protein